MALTDTKIGQTKPTDKAQKLFDGGGLLLLVKPTGQRYWRLKYRSNGKEKLLALGVYPDVPLAAARKQREIACESIAVGNDPGGEKKLESRLAKLARANPFEAVARGWLEERKSFVQAAQHDKTLARLENDAFPWLRKRPVSEIDAPEILAILERVDGRGARFTGEMPIFKPPSPCFSQIIDSCSRKP